MSRRLYCEQNCLQSTLPARPPPTLLHLVLEPREEQLMHEGVRGNKMKYALDVPTSGEFADPRVLAGLACDAEQAGWDGFFIWDVVFAQNQQDLPIVDPWVALAAIASQTKSIRIGAFMTPLPRRRPWQVARAAVSLDHLTNGRLIFGAGLGYQALDFIPFGEDYDPSIRAEKLDEGLQILAGLWTGKAFSFHGKHYQINNVQFLPQPVQAPRIPVWVAGGWPNRKPLRRAANWDGIYLMDAHVLTGMPLTPEDICEIEAYVKTHRHVSGHFDIAICGQTPTNAKKGAKLVQPYIEAGATWWVEAASPETLKAYRKRIREGPPKV